MCRAEFSMELWYIEQHVPLTVLFEFKGLLYERERKREREREITIISYMLMCVDLCFISFINKSYRSVRLDHIILLVFLTENEGLYVILGFNGAHVASFLIVFVVLSGPLFVGSSVIVLPVNVCRSNNGYSLLFPNFLGYSDERIKSKRSNPVQDQNMTMIFLV
jgi:hypothetical protein